MKLNFEKHHHFSRYLKGLKSIFTRSTTALKVIVYSFILVLAVPCSSFAASISIIDYGAKGDGITLNTKSIQSAIDACAKAGGGVVVFPAGRYVSGTIFMKSRVSLNMEPGAVLEGSKNINDYPVSVPKIRSYTDNYTNKSLIYGEDLEYTGISGQGIIDGNGASFTVSNELFKSNLFDSYKARPYVIRLINCKNVLIRDISILNSPMWVQHYLACKNVTIDGVSVNSRVNHNNDGIDIDACEQVRISNCDIVSGDDGIVIKSTLDKVCKNVTVTNCTVSSNCSAIKLGTESNGGYQNISVNNCTVYDTRLAGIALEMVDGGPLENVSISGINMTNVNTAIFVRLANRGRIFKENMSKPGMGSLSNVIISNIQAKGVGKLGCSITGLPSYPVRYITLRDINLTYKGGGTVDLIRRNIEEFPEKYPECTMFGSLPAYGFYCRHIMGLTMENIILSYESIDYRPAIYLNDVSDSQLSGIKASCEAEAGSILYIDNSQNLLIRDCNETKNIEAFSTLMNGSKNIGFIHNQTINKNNIYRSDSTIKKAGIIVQ